MEDLGYYTDGAPTKKDGTVIEVDHLECMARGLVCRFKFKPTSD